MFWLKEPIQHADDRENGAEPEYDVADHHVLHAETGDADDEAGDGEPQGRLAAFRLLRLSLFRKFRHGVFPFVFSIVVIALDRRPPPLRNAPVRLRPIQHENPRNLKPCRPGSRPSAPAPPGRHETAYENPAPTGLRPNVIQSDTMTPPLSTLCRA